VLDESKASLMRVRLTQARECLDAAVLVLDAGKYKDAANRSYYCIFHAMRAVLALDGFDSKKHAGIMSEFGRRYIKTGLFPSNFSKLIRNAFEVRNDCDYNDFYVISKEEVTTQIENAKTFIAAVEAYIETL
jgi:uncharacterized protein (UPF0332 family)